MRKLHMHTVDLNQAAIDVPTLKSYYQEIILWI